MSAFTPHAADLFGQAAQSDQHGSKLGEAFLLPPFTVLNAREGWWQERKRAWLALGIQSELGRGGGNDQRIHERDETSGRVFGATRRDGPDVEHQ